MLLVIALVLVFVGSLGVLIVSCATPPLTPTHRGQLERRQLVAVSIMIVTAIMLVSVLERVL